METNLDMAARAEKALEFICLTLLNSPKYKPRPHWDPEASQNVLPSMSLSYLMCGLCDVCIGHISCFLSLSVCVCVCVCARVRGVVQYVYVGDIYLWCVRYSGS